MSTQVSVEGNEGDAALAVTVRLSQKALHTTRFRNAFLDPSRQATIIDHRGEIVVPVEDADSGPAD